MEVPGADRPILVRLVGDLTLKAGAPVRLAFDPAHLYAFDAGGRALPRMAMRSAS